MIILLVLGGAGIAYAAGWFHAPFFHSQAADKPAVSYSAIACKPGVWGNLEYVPIYIEPPAEFLPVNEIENASKQWKFPDYTGAALSALLDNTSLADDQKTGLMMTCAPLPGGGVVVTPAPELILSMDEKTRAVIYGVLSRFQGNSAHDYRAFFPAAKFDDFFSHSDLPPGTVKLIRQLSYHRGHLLFFCDAPLVLSRLQAPAEKIRFLKTIYRKSTLLLRLDVTPDSDIAALCNYWSKAAWGKDIRPMLESLARVPGGAPISIVHLLPPRPGGDLFTFPFPSLKPEETRKDCHWTALNFFRDPPDPRFAADDATKQAAIKQTLENDYYPAEADPAYGDLVEIFRPNGELVHSSVFIADNIVYTKNSSQFIEPYMLMTIKDMTDAISTNYPEGEQLQIRVFRNKYY